MQRILSDKRPARWCVVFDPNCLAHLPRISRNRVPLDPMSWNVVSLYPIGQFGVTSMVLSALLVSLPRTVTHHRGTSGDVTRSRLLDVRLVLHSQNLHAASPPNLAVVVQATGTRSRSVTAASTVAASAQGGTLFPGATFSSACRRTLTKIGAF